MIQFKHVNKTFRSQSGDVQALSDITFAVEEGQIFGVIGSSGAGKSTLIRCVNQLESPDNGQVIVDGVDITALNKRDLRLERQRMAMIFQHFNLLANRTLYRNIALPLEMMRVPRQAIQQRIMPLMDLVGLTDKMHSYPHELSGGQKQRTAIARALAVKPKVLLCDEATSALDPKTTQSILRLLRSINQQFGLTILLITHEMDVVKTLCDRVAVIEQGRIIEENRVEDFFIHQQTELAKQFVHASTHEQLPQALLDQLQSEPAEGLHPVVRMVFVGHKTSEPVISQISQRFQVDINILQSHMDYVHGRSMGFMTFMLKGDGVTEQAARAFIEQQQHINAEVIGYVD